MNTQYDCAYAQGALEGDLNTASQELYSDPEPRAHLGASIIGGSCDARLWHEFRWLKQEKHDGRTLRIFDRGKREEKPLVILLRKIGFDVREFDENGKQWAISGVNGHFGGSPDALGIPPSHYGITEPIVIEFKTFNDNQFRKLQTNKVKIHKPQHYAQMCCLGRGFGLRLALYIAVNKNTDEIYFEFVELDWKLADDKFRKAEMIVRATEQPLRISQSETYFECRWCPGHAICHKGEKPEKNCRSCKYAVPTVFTSLTSEEAAWQCTNNNCITGGQYLEPETIREGCESWEPIING